MALQNPEPELGARGSQGEGGESGLTSGRCRPDVVHLHDDIHALDHLAEDGVLRRRRVVEVVEERVVLRVEEELRAAAVRRARVR